MDIKINVEGKIKKLVEERVSKVEKLFWNELEKLRRRIVDLEIKNMDVKRIKLPGKNHK